MRGGEGASFLSGRGGLRVGVVGTIRVLVRGTLRGG